MSEIDIRYRVALGDLVLVANGVDLSAVWGWIPMIDMALALHDIREQLLANSAAEAVFEFTESDATIIAKRIGNDVRITASYVPRSETVSLPEFWQAIGEFRDKVFRESVQRFPTLEGNETFRSLRARTVLA